MTDATTETMHPKRSDAFCLVDPPGPQLVRGKTLVAPFSNTLWYLNIMARCVRGRNNIICTKEAGDMPLEIRHRFMIDGEYYYCILKPTVITRTDKETKQKREYLAWPGDREMLIESVLFMLASNRGFQQTPKTRFGGIRYQIEFTLYDIFTALSKIGRKRSYTEIFEALVIMRDSRTIIYKESNGSKVEVTNNIIGEASFETSGHGRNRDRMKITFNDFVTDAIMNMDYTQYAFASVHATPYELARHLHFFMLLNYRNMSENRPITVRSGVLLESFGKKHLTVAQARRDMRAALQKLQEQELIASYSDRALKVIHNGEVDYAYNIMPTVELVSQVIQSNKKRKGLSTLIKRLEESDNAMLPVGPALDVRVWESIT